MDPPQSSRTWTRPSQLDSGWDSRNHQHVHNIANQHPVGETARRKEYPPKAAATTLEGEAKDRRSRRADSTIYFMVRTARTQQGIVQKPRPPGTECPEHNQPTTRGSSRTHTTTSNPTTMSKSSIHPTTLLAVCFVAEDPKKNTFERSSQKQASKLLSIKLRHKGKSQDEGSN
jgi:hypothetical protein